MRVLVVDDNVDLAELLGELLDELGHTAKVCTRSTDALDLVVTFAADAVLVDLGMPVVDGYEVARRLGELPRPPVIIAMSGRRPDDDRARAAGFDGCLLKPIDVGTLSGVLDAIAARAG